MIAAPKHVAKVIVVTAIDVKATVALNHPRVPAPLGMPSASGLKNNARAVKVRAQVVLALVAPVLADLVSVDAADSALAADQRSAVLAARIDLNREIASRNATRIVAASLTRAN